MLWPVWWSVQDVTGCCFVHREAWGVPAPTSIDMLGSRADVLMQVRSCGCAAVCLCSCGCVWLWLWLCLCLWLWMWGCYSRWLGVWQPVDITLDDGEEADAKQHPHRSSARSQALHSGSGHQHGARRSGSGAVELGNLPGSQMLDTSEPSENWSRSTTRSGSRLTSSSGSDSDSSSSRTSQGRGTPSQRRLRKDMFKMFGSSRSLLVRSRHNIWQLCDGGSLVPACADLPWLCVGSDCIQWYADAPETVSRVAPGAVLWWEVVCVQTARGGVWVARSVVVP